MQEAPAANGEDPVVRPRRVTPRGVHSRCGAFLGRRRSSRPQIYGCAVRKYGRGLPPCRRGGERGRRCPPWRPMARRRALCARCPAHGRLLRAGHRSSDVLTAVQPRSAKDATGLCGGARSFPLALQPSARRSWFYNEPRCAMAKAHARRPPAETIWPGGYATRFAAPICGSSSIRSEQLDATETKPPADLSLSPVNETNETID